MWVQTDSGHLINLAQARRIWVEGCDYRGTGEMICDERGACVEHYAPTRWVAVAEFPAPGLGRTYQLQHFDDEDRAWAYVRDLAKGLKAL